MDERIVGRIRRVNGPVVEADGVQDAMMMELVQVGKARLVGEIVKLDSGVALVQVYEDTTGVMPGENVYGTGMPLSVELGPGLIGTIYDGIQRPLERIRSATGTFIERGISIPGLDRERSWDFAPACEAGEHASPGMIVGTVQETSRVEHRVMVPPGVEGTIESIIPAGSCVADDEIAVISIPAGGKHRLTLVQQWPIRVPRPVQERRPIEAPLVTGQRVIDTLFPLAKGGAVAIPGGFGTGKTMTQHAVAKWCDADIIVYIGCGERGNEMTDVLTDFPKLVDPRTGLSLMERTILIANTSNMPVSAREASIYTGETHPEYCRDQGY
ncbi:MAG: V-type ATP synthase subunit A, partial [Spirochaetales bacterium]|nr:V-type ATP synthase subunit A [Spirochaetales bacterium]